MPRLKSAVTAAASSSAQRSGRVLRGRRGWRFRRSRRRSPGRRRSQGARRRRRRTLVSSKRVADVFKTAFEAELKNRGFRVGEGKTLSVTVDRFYNDFKTGFWSGEGVGELEMQVAVGSYRRPIKTSYRHAVQVAGGTNVKQSLEGAMQQAIEKLFADSAFIAALLN